MLGNDNSGGDKRNLVLLLVLSLAILLGGDYLIRWFQGTPAPEAASELPDTSQTLTHSDGTSSSDVLETTPSHLPLLSYEEAIKTSPRLSFETATLKGSFNLQGGHLDDVTLKNYRTTVAPDSPSVQLLSPASTAEAYYAAWLWSSAPRTTSVQDAPLQTPDRDALWQGQALPAKTPGTWDGMLWWESPQGVRFERHITIDDKGMLFVSEKIHNKSDVPLTLTLAQQIRRSQPQQAGQMMCHEGAVGVLDGSLKEWTYEKLQEKGVQLQRQTRGWLGITDKFWLVAFAPQGDISTRLAVGQGHAPVQVDVMAQPLTVPAGGTAEVPSRLYVGAKVLSRLDHYEAALNIPHFDLAVDFGWFYFITKPTFYVLSWLQDFFGSFAMAILLFTVLIKLLFFPLASRSYRSMAKMKELAPEIQKLQSRLKDDKQRMGQEVMALYKKHKVNPVSGCLPMVLQIPFFFALYKVLSVSIEMRHAPFWGWITDLSAPDPTHFLNLFGLLPFQPPAFLHIGLWPLLMGGTMFLQQRLSPPTADPVQQKIFLYGMPVMFTFMFGNLAAGVVIYWTWNNLLSVAQQKYMTRLS